MKALKNFNPQVTANFNINEMAGHDGTGVPWNLLDNAIELLQNLQVLRTELAIINPKVSIKITSGYRNATYNKSIGGATESQHIEATAADIKAAGFTPKQVAAKIEQLIKAGKMKNGGVGIYTSWTHYDIGPGGRRWNG